MGERVKATKIVSVQSEKDQNMRVQETVVGASSSRTTDAADLDPLPDLLMSALAATGVTIIEDVLIAIKTTIN